MRMIAPDIVLLAAGILIFGGAAAGLYGIGGFDTVTETGSALGSFNVTFALKDGDAITNPVTAYSASGSSNFNLQATNVTTVLISVACSDTQPGAAQNPYRLRVEVYHRGTKKAEKPNTNCGSPIELQVDVAPTPAGGAVAGRTEAEARSNLKPSANSTAGQGEWSVRYFGSRTNTVPDPLPTPQTPPGGSIKLTPRIWEAKLSPLTK